MIDAVLAAALEHIPAATFLVAAGRLVASNRIGAVWLAADRTHVTLVACRSGPDLARFEVTAFSRDSYLATLRSPTLAIARSWRITRRETEVAAWIVRGASNRRIAAELACSLKTVEHHVSSILRKVDVENRASLILALLGA